MCNSSITDKFNRCVMVMNEELKGGLLANAIAVISLTVGQRHPQLVGDNLIDAHQVNYPGLITGGIPMLCSRQSVLHELREKALTAGCDVICFPVIGQQTKNYDEFKTNMKEVASHEVEYTGIAIVGEKKTVSKIVKNLPLIQ